MEPKYRSGIPRKSPWSPKREIVGRPPSWLPKEEIVRRREAIYAELDDVLGQLPAWLFTPEEVDWIRREIRTHLTPGLFLGRQIDKKISLLYTALQETKDKFEKVLKIMRLL